MCRMAISLGRAPSSGAIILDQAMRALEVARPHEERVMQSFLEIFDIYLLEAMVNGILLAGCWPCWRWG